jgi:hypothetical protein
VEHLNKLIKFDGKEEQYINYRNYVKKKETEEAASVATVIEPCKI